MRRVPLMYADDADAALDRPAHVRAASGVVWHGDRLLVLQDDANFLALADPRTGRATTIVMPRGTGGRRQFDRAIGNKDDKFDFEALTRTSVDALSLLLAFGSGSSAGRESIALIDPTRGDVRIVAAPDFYAALRADSAFAGSDMNIEGAIVVGAILRLFGRGNGAARGTLRAVNATCDVDARALLAHLEARGTPAPLPRSVVQYDLDVIDGVPLGFTDATALDDAGGVERFLYLAAAEQSADAISDGAVTGSAIGIVTRDGGARSARWAPLVDERGDAFTGKAEGLVLGDVAAGIAYVVIDSDTHDAPSELCELRLTGFGAP